MKSLIIFSIILYSTIGFSDLNSTRVARKKSTISSCAITSDLMENSMKWLSPHLGLVKTINFTELSCSKEYFDPILIKPCKPRKNKYCIKHRTLDAHIFIGYFDLKQKKVCKISVTVKRFQPLSGDSNLPSYIFPDFKPNCINI